MAQLQATGVTGSLVTTGAVGVGTSAASPGTFNVLGTSYFSDDIHLRDGATASGDILVRIYDSSDDGVIDVYQNNAVVNRINGNGSSYFNAGNVGIGTTSPLASLQIGNGTSNTSNRSSVAILSADGGNAVLNALSLVNSRASADGNGTAINFHNANNYSPTGRIVSVQDSGTNASLRFSVYNSTDNALVERITLLSTGNVGIGTISPSNKLDIRDGNIELSDTAFSRIPEIRFTGFSGGGRYIYAGIKADEDGAFNGHLEFWTTPNSAGYVAANAAFAERMRITSAGNVGLGTSVATDRLYIKNTTGDAGIVLDNGTQVLRFDQNSIRTTTASQIAIFTNNTLTNGIYINSSGNVGVGTATPNLKFHVTGQSVFGDNNALAVNSDAFVTVRAAQFAGIDVTSLRTSGNVGGLRAYDSTGTVKGQLLLKVDGGFEYFSGSSLFNILSSGNVGIGTINPVEKLHVVGAVKISRTSTQGENIFIYSQQTAKWSGATFPGLIENVGNNALEIGSTAALPVFFATSGSVRMSIQGGGNVGIGTTSPSGNLHIYSGLTSNNVRLTTGANAGTGYDINLYLNGGANNSEMSILMGIVGNEDRDRIRTYQGNMYFRTNDSENMIINSSGNVGIGTATPQQILHTYKAGDWQLRLQNPDAGGGYWNIGQSDNNFNAGGGKLLFVPDSSASNNATVVFTNSGNVGIGTNNPTFSAIPNNTVKGLQIQNIGNDTQASLRLTGHNNTGSPGQATFTELLHAGGDLRFDINHNGTAALTINPSSNVGINTTAPVFKLDVNGTLRASTLYTDRYIYDSGDTNTYLDFVSGDQFRIVAGGVEMWRWVEGGTDYSYTSFPVGIGTAVPLADLHIRDSTAIIRLESTSGPYSNISSNTIGSIEISADEGNTGASSNINFKVDGSDLMRLVNGNVGINNSSPQFKLHVLGTTGGDSTFKEGILIENSNATDGEPTLAFKVKSMADGTYWFTGLNQGANYDIAYGSSFTNAGTIMRVTNTGNVGIGTVTPSRKLEVLEGSIQVVANFQNTSTVSSRIKFADANTGAENVNIGATGTKLAMWTNNTVRMTIISGGNVGIGTTNPTHLLHVNGTLRVDNAGSAPDLKDGTPPENYVGDAGYWLGEPSGWLAINVGGTPYVIPLYE